MDVSGEVADLMVKESIQLTEASIKLLAAGSKNLAAFLWALAKDMARLLKEGKELKVFRVKESDLAEFQVFAKKNVLYAAVKDKRSDSGMVDLITNADFVSQVNLFMERRGYPAPAQGEVPKKDGPRAQRDSFSPQRGNTSNPSQTRTSTAEPTSEKPSVKGRLAALQAASESMKAAKTPQGRSAPPKTR